MNQPVINHPDTWRTPKVIVHKAVWHRFEYHVKDEFKSRHGEVFLTGTRKCFDEKGQLLYENQFEYTKEWLLNSRRRVK